MAGTQLAARISAAGAGHTVVLIHGVGLSRWVWRQQVAALAPHLRVVSYDLPGHGSDERGFESDSLDAYVEDLASVLDAAGVDKAVLVGAAFGSFIARRFARLHPERVAGLVLVSPLGRRTPEQSRAVAARFRETAADGVAGTLDASVERWLSPPFRAAHPDIEARLRAVLLATPFASFLSAYRVFATVDGAIADEAAQIAAPVLVLTGEDDANATPQMARQVSEALNDATLTILPGVRHLVSLEAGAALGEAVLGFVNERTAYAYR
ncbi:alpha/beta fold hydrolase [Ancylobacter defluvii]|uniref:3-oxoadipate enol-lactonase n=1 Tax=Ancylobacter defluvii TaxID=1282440 RepID=A0A9W6JV26_9HYPH|nr:alpha/beta hydrolase [Ancylobacter defluvii]MBS7588532.1 alpha/beta fold hydrolase [Ancylobacter defluvii]GLK83812.1 3-oxoadipate enol-lactonase [Ancylobacter defluvii]